MVTKLPLILRKTLAFPESNAYSGVFFTLQCQNILSCFLGTSTVIHSSSTESKCGLAIDTVCLLRPALDSLGIVDRPGITKVDLRMLSSTSVSRSATRHLHAAFEETRLYGARLILDNGRQVARRYVRVARGSSYA